MFNTVLWLYEMYVGKHKYLKHDLSAVDIPFIEMILH